MLRLRSSAISRLRGHQTETNDLPTEGNLQDEETERKVQKSSLFSIDNILWLTVSMMVFYWSDIARVVLYDEAVDRFWLYIGFVLISINLSFAGYFIIWLSYWKKVPSCNWEKENPIAIPIATSAFVSGTFCCTLGLWPVWSILTPIILLILFMGFIVFISILPEW